MLVSSLFPHCFIVVSFLRNAKKWLFPKGNKRCFLICVSSLRNKLNRGSPKGIKYQIDWASINFTFGITSASGDRRARVLIKTHMVLITNTRKYQLCSTTSYMYIDTLTQFFDLALSIPFTTYLETPPPYPDFAPYLQPLGPSPSSGTQRHLAPCRPGWPR